MPAGVVCGIFILNDGANAVIYAPDDIFCASVVSTCIFAVSEDVSVAEAAVI